MKHDKRVERNIQSVLLLRDFLREIIQNPVSFVNKVDLFNSLKSQGSLSKFCDESRGIKSSSLNTTKRIAEISLEGGFEALDRLRISSIEAIETEKNKKKCSNKKSKSGLSKRVNELEIENQLIRQDLLRLTHAFDKSLIQGRNYALKSDKPSLKALCDKEQRELCDMLSLKQRPLRMIETSCDSE